MLIGHNCHGKGGGPGPVTYCLALVDANGIERTEVSVLRGNPESTAAVIDSIKNEWKYTSAVIAWTPDDNPTPEQIEAVLDDYYKLAFAGMEQNRYSSTAILHGEQNGGTHVHIISARIDLQSGKAHNPCPPNAEYLFNQIAKHHNFKHGWDRPDDPARSRTLVKEKWEYLLDAQEIKKGLDVEVSSKQLLTDYIENRVQYGLIEDQAGVVESLREFGEITRVGRDYIGIKVDGEKKAIRLRGRLFGGNFSRESTEKIRSRPDAGSKVDGRKSELAFGKFVKACEKKAEYNIGRYGRADRSSDPENRKIERADQRYLSQERQVELAYQAPTLDDIPISDPHSDVCDNQQSRVDDLSNAFDDRKTARVYIPEAVDRSAGPDERGQKYRGKSNMVRQQARGLEKRRGFLGSSAQGVSNGFLETSRKKEDIKSKHNRGLSVSRLHSSSLVSNKGLQRISNQPLLSHLERFSGRESIRMRPERATIRTGNGGIDDGIRDKVTQAFDQADRACRGLNEGIEGLHKADLEIRALGRSSGNLDRASSETSRSFERNTDQIMRNSADEVERFKTEINISEYLATYGFTRDKKSCATYAVMRKDAKKIIITKAQDGHYVYTDAHNESDNGSIIDICQRLTGKNLGQVRRELRPWIGKGQDRPRPPIKAWQKIYRTEPDYIKVAIGFNNAEPVFDFSYFDERGIDKTVVNSFPSTIRQSSDGMLLFRHIKKNVYLSGYEKKNAGYTGFSKGGKKGVCVFHDGQNKVDNLVITETAIDALSKAQLDGLPESTAYCSIGGTPSEEQIIQLAEIVKNNKLRAIIAVDRDQGGERITQSIRTLLPDAEIVLPKKKDWNDDLKEKIEKEERWEKRNNSVRDSSHENDNEPSM